jgi:predicted transcriptional regulator
MMHPMRTTITLPDDLHDAVAGIARDRHQSLSEAVSDLLRQALMPGERPFLVTTDPRTGLPVIHVGRPVTSEDVRSQEEEE